MPERFFSSTRPTSVEQKDSTNCETVERSTFPSVLRYGETLCCERNVCVLNVTTLQSHGHNTLQMFSHLQSVIWVLDAGLTSWTLISAVSVGILSQFTGLSFILCVFTIVRIFKVFTNCGLKSKKKSLINQNAPSFCCLVSWRKSTFSHKMWYIITIKVEFFMQSANIHSWQHCSTS